MLKLQNMNLSLVVLITASTIYATYASSSGSSEDPEIERTFVTKCMKDLGCFETGPPFFSVIHRPISLLPQDPEYIGTEFLLFGPRNPSNSILLKPNLNSLEESTFDPALEIIILIPGYTSKYEEGNWQFMARDELLKYKKYNIIAVKWNRGNGPPYPQAVANGRVVGAQVAQLVQFLENNAGIDRQNVHIIGHSLGAHIAGWAGERVKKLGKNEEGEVKLGWNRKGIKGIVWTKTGIEKISWTGKGEKEIGRISGLDPAGPYFQHAPDTVRLDKTDATFVDIIHTNGADTALNGLGIMEPIGHLDFYPNGGEYQPNCSIVSENENSLTKNVLSFVETTVANSCSHGRAPLLYIWSILRCSFLSIACDSWEDFENGRCGGDYSRDKKECSVMGFHAKNINTGQNKNFYLRTSGAPPYCL